MAKNRFDIIIKMEGAAKIIKDLNLTEKGMKRLRSTTAGLRKSIGAFRNNLLLVSFTLGAVIKASQALVATYRKQAEAEALLTRGLKNLSSNSKDASANLQALASSLQKVTTFGDEQIIMAQAQLATFGLTEDTIAHLTERMLDLSVGAQTDLISSAKMLGKAFTGQATALSRAGVVIDKAALKQAQANGATEEAIFLLKQLDNNYKGLARSLAETELGELDQLKLKLGDVNEQLGEMMIPIETWWTGLKLGAAENIVFLGLLKEEMGEINVATQSIAVGIWDAWGRANKRMEEFVKTIKDAKDPATNTTDAMRKLNIQLDKQLNSLVGIAEMYQDADLAQVKYLGTREKGMRLAAEEAALHEMEVNGLLKGNELRIKRNELLIKEIQNSAQLAEERKSLNTDALNTLTQMTSMWEQNMKARKDAEISRLQATDKFKRASKGNQERMEKEALAKFKQEAVIRFRIEQAASLSNIYMKTAEASAKALVINPAYSALITALGLAQAGIVLAQKPPAFALGGDFTTNGPQMIMVGDNPGGRERVQITPESSPNINGPQGVTINIQGNMVGNEEFVRDVMIPEINKAQTMRLA